MSHLSHNVCALQLDFCSLFKAVYNTNYSAESILKIAKSHAYTERVKLVRMQFLVLALHPRKARKPDNILGDESWKKTALSGATEYEMNLEEETHICTGLRLCKWVFFFHIRKQSLLINY